MSKLISIFLIAWQDIIAVLHHSWYKPKGKYSEDATILRNDGIVFIEDFLSEETCDQLKVYLQDLVSQHNDSVKLPSGSSLNFRSNKNPEGYDHGMIDIHIEENDLPPIEELKKMKDIGEVVAEATGQVTYETRINAYINRGVKNTRTFHLDNNQPSLHKAFVYLTDVPDEDFGPYAFIRKTHKLSVWPYINSIANIFSKRRDTDMTLYPSSKITYALAKKGTLIISSQNGLHRGMPQTPDKERFVLLFGYISTSKLNYLGRTVQTEIATSKQTWHPLSRQDVL